MGIFRRGGATTREYFRRILQWFGINTRRLGVQKNDGLPLLPNDMLYEVFSHLPAKFALQVQLVSKDVHTMISSDLFQLKQSYHHKTISGFFNQTYSSHQFISLDPEAGVPNRSLEFMAAANVKILGSSHGLLFCHNKPEKSAGNLSIFNPVRHTWWPLPSTAFGNLSNAGVAVRFGHGPLTRDYKLIVVAPTAADWPTSMDCKIYDSAVRSWTVDKRLHFGCRDVRLQQPVVCGDTVFWASDFSGHMKADPYVVALDIEKECTELIATPKEAAIEYDDEIAVASREDNMVCFVHYRRRSCTWNLWRLKKTKEWVKIHEINNLYGQRFITLCNVDKDKLLVFSAEDRVYSYNVEDGSVNELARVGSYHPTLFPYSNTLLPCRRQEGVRGCNFYEQSENL
ncbi:F-box protein [Canna indica]|uniref:F-box protein n=1 Tax=Canna indica TaxID=4628 RepID=A0AAQ3QNB8_9LILI|nr:F-box protein [Canna indica]